MKNDNAKFAAAAKHILDNISEVGHIYENDEINKLLNIKSSKEAPYVNIYVRKRSDNVYVVLVSFLYPVRIRSIDGCGLKTIDEFTFNDFFFRNTCERYVAKMIKYYFEYQHVTSLICNPVFVEISK